MNAEFDKMPVLERHKQEQSDIQHYSSPTKINCEQITLVWLDTNAVDAASFTDDVRVTEEILRQLNDYVLLFDNEHECLAHVESIKSETVLLIVAGSCASSNLLRQVHGMRHVDTIFIFCKNMDLYESLLLNKDYYKIIGIFNEQTSLAFSIQCTIELVDKQTTVFALYNTEKQKSMRNLSRESGSFIFLQLVKQVMKQMLLNTGSTEESKKEMIDRCRLYYRGNKKEMENIDEFESEYTPDQAIRWYTRNSFVFKLINKSLRTEDINVLYTYRFYIVDLCACLAENYQLMREVMSTMRVYRGTKLSNEEIQRLNESIGHLISVNGFLSTSRLRSVAEMYAGIGVKTGLVSTSKELESVVFDIEVNLDAYPDVILADITHISTFKDEKEVLFDLGTVFEIQSLRYDIQNHSWICQMAATDKGRAIANQYLNFKQNELNNSHDIEITFGDLLYDMGEWLKSLIYYEKLRLKRPNDPQVHFGIGRSYEAFNNSDQALSHLQRAYDLAMGGNSEWLVLAAKTCYYASRVHYICNRFDDAIKFGNEALEFYRQAGEDDNQAGIAQTLTSIGYVYFLKCDPNESLKCFQLALHISQRICPFDHPDKSVCLCYLAYSYYHLGEYEQALTYILEGSSILQRLLPKDHPQLSSVDTSIGKLFYKQGRYEEALEQFCRAADADRRRKTDNRRTHAVILNNIGKTFYRLQKLDEASVHYEKALNLIETLLLASSSSDHVDLAYTCKNIGEIHMKRGNLTSAVDLFERARDMYARIFAHDGDHRDIAKCWYLIGQTHVLLENSVAALEAFEKAVRMWTTNLPEYHPDLALCHQSIAEFYLHNMENKERAIVHFQQALSIYEKRLAGDQEPLKEIRNKLAGLQC